MKSNVYIFLLYVSVVLIITFLQQEFVLMPELQNFDLVDDEAKAQLLERWQKWRWVSFVVTPLLLLLRLGLVSLCLFVGSFFFSEMSGRVFKDWWTVAMNAQAVMILYSVVLCITNYCCPLKVSEQRDIHPQCCCNGIADDFSEGKPLS